MPPKPSDGRGIFAMKPFCKRSSEIGVVRSIMRRSSAVLTLSVG